MEGHARPIDTPKVEEKPPVTASDLLAASLRKTSAGSEGNSSDHTGRDRAGSDKSHEDDVLARAGSGI